MSTTAALVLLPCFAIGLAGCGGSSSAQQFTPPPATASTTVVTTVTPPPTVVTTVTPPPVTATPTHTSTCLDTEIVVTANGPGFGLGHAGVAVLFTNTGSVPCSLHGYPGVAGLDAAGHETVQARRTPNGYIGGVMDGGEPTAVLAHGQTASALVEGGVPASNSNCTEEHGLLVTPPGGTVPTRLTPSLGVHCADVQVHPVVPGTDGDAPPSG
ncbi:MAG: DUF4232 domain-containing protein [Sciscionella sp.]